SLAEPELCCPLFGFVCIHLEAPFGRGAGGMFCFGLAALIGSRGFASCGAGTCPRLLFLHKGQSGFFALHPASPVPSENLVVMILYSSRSWGNRSTKGKITLP